VRRFPALLALAALSACTTAQIQTAEADVSGTIAVMCSEQSLLSAFAGATGLPGVIATDAFAVAFCRSPVVTQENAAWLAGVQGQVKAAAAGRGSVT
jgi:hypothetical protein